MFLMQSELQVDNCVVFVLGVYGHQQNSTVGPKRVYYKIKFMFMKHSMSPGAIR